MEYKQIINAELDRKVTMLGDAISALKALAHEAGENID